MATQEVKESPEQIALHEEAERRMVGYKYTKPESLGDANKGLVRLAGTDLMRGVVQVLEAGGENVLHFHEGMDSFWMVLKGRVRFYGPGDKLVGEYGPFEGVVTPRGARYWFEKASDDEDLELLQIAAYDTQSAGARRVAVDPTAPKSNRNQWFDGQNNNQPIERG